MSDGAVSPFDRVRHRVSVLPNLIERAPAWVSVVAGVALIILGVLIAYRPLVSLTVLGIYIGISCIVTGVMELAHRDVRSRAVGLALAVLWIAAGLAVIAWLGRSLEVLPVAVAILLIISGVARLGNLTEGQPSARALHGASSIAEIIFGILALLWLDATTVVIAILFGIRTIVFGIALLARFIATRRSAKPAVSAAMPNTHASRANTLRWAGAVGVILAAIGGGVLSHALRSDTKKVDAFYAAPDDVPNKPGVLLRAEAWPGTPPPKATVIRILYTTTEAEGVPAIASAVVVLPTTPSPTPRTVVAWDHGTTGIARECAPSLMNTMFQVDGVPAVNEAVDKGWAIVASDYPGQGTAGNFPYLIGQSEGRSSLDAVRAARQIADSNLSATTVIWGHSQGGHAALWAAKLAPTYAPDLTVVGVAALSPAAKPRELVEAIADKGVVGVTAVVASWILVPYSRAYPDVKLADYVRPSALGLMNSYASRCTTDKRVTVSVLSALALAADEPLYVSGLGEGSLATRLRENQADGPFAMPILLSWGSQDEVIPPRLQHAYVNDLCASGQPVASKDYPGFSHMGVLGKDSGLIPALVSWTQDRIDGVAAPNTCPA